MTPAFLQQFTKNEFLHFLAVGLLNTGFGFTVFSIFVWLGIPYAIAIALSTIAGVLFNFQTIGKLVFNNSDWKRLGRFLAVYVLLYAINVAGVTLLAHFSLNVYISNAIVVGPIAVLGYLLQKRFVFNSRITADK